MSFDRPQAAPATLFTRPPGRAKTDGLDRPAPPPKEGANKGRAG